MDTVGTRLKISRIKANLRQDEVVDKLKQKGYDITQTTLSRYENDKREIGIELLKQLSLLYRVDVNSIIWSEYELYMIPKCHNTRE